MKMSTKTILLTSIALFTAGALQAQIILYSDNFDGGAVTLNGTAPDISVTSATHGTGGNWTASAGIFQNGTLLSSGSNTGSLAFKPVNGYLYTLTMTTNFANGIGYVGVGFAGANNSTSALGSDTADGGILWSLTRPLRTSDSIRQEAHADSTGGTGLLSPTGNSSVNPSTISIVLDTRDGTGLWDVQYLVGGSEFTSLTNIGAAYENKINAVKFSNANNNVSNTMQSFQLTVIPEPSTYLLLTGSLTALIILRRRRAS
jgi:hypothetical protein